MIASFKPVSDSTAQIATMNTSSGIDIELNGKPDAINGRDREGEGQEDVNGKASTKPTNKKKLLIGIVSVALLALVAGLAVEFGSKKGSAQSSAASEVASVNLDNDDEGCEEVAVMLSGKVRFHMY